jgi:phage gpG-like protein
MATSVTITGADVAQRRLRAIGERAGKQRETFERESRDAQRRIRGVPVDTGRLERSVHGGKDSVRKVSDRGYVIGTSVEYARFVFGGTKTMPARPPDVPRDLGRRAAQAIASDLKRP